LNIEALGWYLATANYTDHTVSVLLNKGDGSFQAKVSYATGHSPVSVAIGDLDGDGKGDLATANEEHGVSVLLNRGDGSFQPRRDYAGGDTPHAVAIGDLNGDGKADLATVNDNTLSVLLNGRDGSFQPKLEYRARNSSGSVAIGDLNGDGKPDLVTVTGDRSVSVLINTPGPRHGAEPEAHSQAARVIATGVRRVLPF
jgi:hypothetical protein